ncbi:XdhC/CoxI family protein [Variovorax sp. J22R133]|uniref:XdhC family protein n=1 Tax=Variovorax brevis TaxID=3053503 RepID=UPI0025761116|nr:XdhC/CoxI family protein [Variovorax sp. J22R133]MDM0113839.1 XdhC/CoxI family protein [Variovorax sp. J22R133]
MTAAAGEQATISPSSILVKALAWHDAGAGVALATVVSAWSTAPRRAGTQMAVHEDGTRMGTLFGESVDSLIATAAREVLASGTDKTVDLAVDDATASTAGMACGGSMSVRLEHVTGGDGGQAGVLRQTVGALQRGQSVVLCTRLSDGRRELIATDDPAPGIWTAEAQKRARMDDTAVVTVNGDDVLFQVFNAPLRLYVVGAVRTARALRDAAQLVGFDVTIVDPRSDMAGEPRFAGAKVVVGDVAVSLRDAQLDSRSAVVMLAHAPEMDDPGIVEALRSRSFYVGALGSRKSHAARLQRLEAAGVSPESAARIRGPAGLAIGAIGPAEIAASIVAEMIATLRGAA